MTFRQNLIVTFFASLVPALLIGGISLFTYFSVNNLDEKIKLLESDSRAIDIYNHFSPNAKFTITRIEFGVFYETDKIKLNKREEFLRKKKSLYSKYKFSPTKREMLEEMRLLVEHYSAEEIDAYELLIFNYCLENKGRIEMFFHQPAVNFYTSISGVGEVRSVKTKNVIDVGVVSAGSSACYKVNIPYEEVPMGRFSYRLDFKVEPSLRSLKFIYKYETEDKINELMSQFSFVYGVNGNGDFAKNEI